MFLNKLNIQLISTFKTENLSLPLLISMENIKENDILQEFIFAEIENNKIIIDDTDVDTHKIKDSYNIYNDKLNHFEILKHIDIHTPLFDNNNLKQLWEIDTVEDLYNYLCKRGFGSIHISILKSKIELLVHELVLKYNSIIVELLELNNKEQLHYNSCMTELQCVYERLQTCYFSENIGKSFIDYSLREKYLIMSYFSKVSSIEDAIEKYKNDYMENSRKEAEHKSKVRNTSRH